MSAASGGSGRNTPAGRMTPGAESRGATPPGGGEGLASDVEYKVAPLTLEQWFFLMCSMVFLFLPVVPGVVDTYLGDPSVLALLLMIVVFSTKFVDGEELNKFNWDLVLVLV